MKIDFSCLKFACIEYLLVALKTIKLAIKALGRQDANLLTADAILKFMIQSLQQNDNAISKELSDALLIRINERRNKDLVSLMKQLVTLDLTANTDLEAFQLSSKTSVLKYAVKIMNRIFIDVVDADLVNSENIAINESDSSECDVSES